MLESLPTLTTRVLQIPHIPVFPIYTCLVPCPILCSTTPIPFLFLCWWVMLGLALHAKKLLYTMLLGQPWANLPGTASCLHFGSDSYTTLEWTGAFWCTARSRSKQETNKKQPQIHGLTERSVSAWMPQEPETNKQGVAPDL